MIKFSVCKNKKALQDIQVFQYKIKLIIKVLFFLSVGFIKLGGILKNSI